MFVSQSYLLTLLEEGLANNNTVEQSTNIHHVSDNVQVFTGTISLSSQYYCTKATFSVFVLSV